MSEYQRVEWGVRKGGKEAGRERKGGKILRISTGSDKLQEGCLEQKIIWVKKTHKMK